MGVTIEQKVEVPVKEAFAESELSQQVDIYVSVKEALKKAVKEITPLTNLVKSMEKELREIGDSAIDDPEAEGVLVGVEYVLTLGKKANAVTSIDKEALRKALGDETFLELAEVKVGDIRKYLNPIQLEVVLTEERKGNRAIKIEQAS